MTTEQFSSVAMKGATFTSSRSDISKVIPCSVTLLIVKDVRKKRKTQLIPKLWLRSKDISSLYTENLY